MFRPSIGGWFIRFSSQGFSIATANFFQWGLPGDVPIAADFDGDGKIELTCLPAADRPVVPPLLVAKLRREQRGRVSMGVVGRRPDRG